MPAAGRVQTVSSLPAAQPSPRSPPAPSPAWRRAGCKRSPCVGWPLRTSCHGRGTPWLGRGRRASARAAPGHSPVVPAHARHRRGWGPAGRAASAHRCVSSVRRNGVPRGRRFQTASAVRRSARSVSGPATARQAGSGPHARKSARRRAGGEGMLPAEGNAPHARLRVAPSAGSPGRHWANAVATGGDGGCRVLAPEGRPGGRPCSLPSRAKIFT